jgi:hypothetical protein
VIVFRPQANSEESDRTAKRSSARGAGCGECGSATTFSAPHAASPRARNANSPRFRRRSRRGQALIEFAIIALVLYLLLAAILTFGLLFWVGSTTQDAVSVGAQEIARMPFPANAVLGLGVLDPMAPTPGQTIVKDDAQFKAQIYDEAKLFVPAGQVSTSFIEFAQTLPLINRLLAPSYIFDAQQDAYRFPGAIVQNGAGETTVLIPVEVAGSPGTIRWVAPVEEMTDDAGVGPFSVTASSSAPNFIAGTVALRINYPFQSASMSNFGPTDNPTGNISEVLSADDARVTEGNTGQYTLVVAANSYADDPGVVAENIHGGRFGMGRQIALPFSNVGQFGVRPYRKVISTQAVVRREVFDFSPPVTTPATTPATP